MRTDHCNWLDLTRIVSSSVLSNLLRVILKCYITYRDQYNFSVGQLQYCNVGTRGTSITQMGNWNIYACVKVQRPLTTRL